MPYLIDTNCLVTLAQRDKSAHRTGVIHSISLLRRRHERLCVCSQNMAEFWTVATRPATSRGGLGLTLPTANAVLAKFETRFEMLPSSQRTYGEWRRLIVDYGVSGVATHDARIAAAMLVHGVEHILTIDRGFNRYSPAITVVDPLTL